MKPSRRTVVVICGLLSLLAALATSPSALAANAFDGVQVVPRCFSSPSGSLTFEFDVVNRRAAPVGNVRLDVYFRRGARLTGLAGHHFGGEPQMRVSGPHAWEADASLNVYSGFALQPVLREDPHSRTSVHPVTLTLTVEGARHAFPTWVCAKP